jgi:hypothetical protein
MLNPSMRRLFTRVIEETRLHILALVESWPALLFAMFWVLLAYMLEGR